MTEGGKKRRTLRYDVEKANNDKEVRRRYLGRH